MVAPNYNPGSAAIATTFAYSKCQNIEDPKREGGLDNYCNFAIKAICLLSNTNFLQNLPSNRDASMTKEAFYPLYIKHMVCPRCITSIGNILDLLGIEYGDIILGKAVLSHQPDKTQLTDIEKALNKQGFEILRTSEQQLVNAVKSHLIKQLNSPDFEVRQNLSVELATLLVMDYSAISRTFANTEGVTIERYAMTLKIEKVKELLSYGEQTISEISFQLNYSSAAHLSGQFRKMTGMSPTQFRKLHNKSRLFISDL